MDIKNLTRSITQLHSDDIEDSLDEDQRRAQYIPNVLLKGLYIGLFNLSLYLLIFFVIYFGLTGQFGIIDIFGFFSKPIYILHAVFIIILSLSIKALRDTVLSKLKDIGSRRTMILALDVVRFLNYTAVYLFFKWALVGNKKSVHLEHSKYMLLAMLAFYVVRKALFWTVILINKDPSSDKAFEKVGLQKRQEMNLHRKIKELNQLIGRLQFFKGELQSRQKSASSSELKQE